jgi:hypothetical protein
MKSFLIINLLVGLVSSGASLAQECTVRLVNETSNAFYFILYDKITDEPLTNEISPLMINASGLASPVIRRQNCNDIFYIRLKKIVNGSITEQLITPSGFPEVYRIRSQ